MEDDASESVNSILSSNENGCFSFFLLNFMYKLNINHYFESKIKEKMINNKLCKLIPRCGTSTINDALFTYIFKYYLYMIYIYIYVTMIN